MNPARLRFAFLVLFAVSWGGRLEGGTIRGAIVEEGSGTPIAARLYVEALDPGEGERFFHATAAAGGGGAVPYEKRRTGNSVEVHTCLGPHGFVAEVPPGRYRLTAVRGKEYTETVLEVEVGERPVEVKLPLRRWIDMAGRGWYSGDTHNHRLLEEQPIVLLAEDLHIGLPLTSWVARFEETPAGSSKLLNKVPNGEVRRIDERHLFWTGNTEYEITSVEGERHVLGALFVIGHEKAIDLHAFPLADLVRLKKEEGALFELDKHNWPWSMMLVPVAGVDLFELTNNHVWRTEFAFSTFFAENAYGPLDTERGADGGFTERGWIDFGFRNYYALLNCGFRILPTAGTASGVHPVPLGFGRVYVETGGETAEFDAWMRGLREGRSFVTTGPMLFTRFNGQPSGSEIRGENGVEIEATVRSREPVGNLEVIVNGEVRTVNSSRRRVLGDGTHEIVFQEEVPVEESGWIAARIFETREDGRPRFAHGAPAFVEVEGKPARPKRAEVEYLLQRVTDEIERHEGVLPAEAVQDFREAARVYGDLLGRAR